jgi:hypothetical protein
MQPYSNPTKRNMEDDLNIFEYGRRPQFLMKKEDDLYYFKTECQPKKKEMQPETLNSKIQ